ncbi:MAG TPA: bifunctional 2-polyprenyl-6-hydroxyphenol methylase/3-demethylubiquinol 3-O-methyltransferase UbiG, partial [Burkholderiaceae bacterium]|nr:bifunctional 2-polyprenyl-6-hydroxyphenol methylase/3-demethylubiquinol 3-O-methyltransferase UbiG [Burkholderiaceae bacterium]
HALNPVRTAWIDQHARLRGQHVLDVGCGAGLLTESMARAGARVTGIDLAAPSLEVARQHAQDGGLAIEYVESSAEDFAASHASTFKVVSCMELLEHVPEPAQTVHACAQLVAPGGWCFFSTLNRNPKAFALAIVGAEYLLNLVPRGTHEYARFIRPSELVRYTRDAGLDLVEIKGLRFNPFNQNVTLCDDTDVNYLLACRRPT